MYNDHIGVIYGATKGGRFLIECQSKTNPNEVMTTWAKREQLIPLDPAIQDLLTSIYIK